MRNVVSVFCDFPDSAMEGQLLQLVVVIFYLGSFVTISQQTTLTCQEGRDILGANFEDGRITKGLPAAAELTFLGSNQTLTVFDGNSVTTGYIGVCYSTSANGCFKAGSDEEECDNYIRSVTDRNGNCNRNSCQVLACGTNAGVPRCATCDYDGSALNCSFTENDPPQDWPYTGDNYVTCQANNIDGSDAFQYEKNDNITLLHESDAGRIYYGHIVYDSSKKESYVGLASITSGGVTSGAVRTLANSEKMVAYDTDFVGDAFRFGDYVYFLFREDAQEFASLSFQQDHSITRYYSRIARICADDSSATGNLVSFLKQTLDCSIGSNTAENGNPIKMYFNEIQDFYFDGSESIHAIFTTERQGTPLSALCVFNLTEIDSTFNTGNFFGSDGGQSSDLWQENDGSGIDPRHGDCSNPNTNDHNFIRDYNLMYDHATQTKEIPLFMVGDRFSNLELNGSSYIISSERGCLYQFDVNTVDPDLGDPCPLEVHDSVQDSTIKDLELRDDGYIVTTTESALTLSSCTELCVGTSVFPDPGDYTVPPNSLFDIYAENTFEEPVIITSIDEGNITDCNDAAYLLKKNESLDSIGSLFHWQILILNDTTVTLTGCNQSVIVYNIYPYNEYTCDETMRRCDEWEMAKIANDYLENRCNPIGTFESDILIVNQQVKECKCCAYNECTDPCCCNHP